MEIFNKKNRWIIFLVLGAIALFYLSILLADIVVLLAISVLLGFIFAPFVRLLEGQGFTRTISTILVFTAFGFLLYLGLSFVIPKFFLQMNQVLASLKDFSLNQELNDLEKKILGVFPLFNKGELSNKVQNIISISFNDAINHITQYVSGIVSIAAFLVIVPFITFYLLKDSAVIHKALIHIVPNKYFEMSYWILKRISLQLGRFVRGWIFDAVFVGTAVGFGFYFIGLPNALPLGVIAGIGHLIPYLGPIIGGVPAIVLSIMQTGDLSQVPLIMTVIVVIYTLDNGFVQPYVFSKSVDMHPIIIILLIITGGELFGILGMLLAVPTATIIKTAATEIYFAFKNYSIAKL
ncbi:MAG: AI-2E family transporter [Ignavibacteriaceae bacterium]|nr:AI-2E family transporter [Ignavibacterium sp.]MCC6256454.1 AI-2E family transporter [Ignavibacteriaceae bacterium]HMN23717.1 AI-2E family transporter [Ignavibacteriaceae bacterium]HRN27568.1 AI-2E family transporter [Ignavibacteriaceae bacterium]HRP92265.1 AI-2E family transporter [Ignavibacteriaceae bacterium]